jgi:hypothetical protein
MRVPESERAATIAGVHDYLLAGVHNVPADRAVAQTVVATFPMAASGSYLVLSHSTDDDHQIDPDRFADLKDANRQQASATGRLRSRAEIVRFFDGFELIDPGLVWVPQWRPRPNQATELDDPG